MQRGERHYNMENSEEEYGYNMHRSNYSYGRVRSPGNSYGGVSTPGNVVPNSPGTGVNSPHETNSSSMNNISRNHDGNHSGNNDASGSYGRGGGNNYTVPNSIGGMNDVIIREDYDFGDSIVHSTSHSTTYRPGNHSQNPGSQHAAPQHQGSSHVTFPHVHQSSGSLYGASPRVHQSSEIMQPHVHQTSSSFIREGSVHQSRAQVYERNHELARQSEERRHNRSRSRERWERQMQDRQAHDRQVRDHRERDGGFEEMNPPANRPGWMQPSSNGRSLTMNQLPSIIAHPSASVTNNTENQYMNSTSSDHAMSSSSHTGNRNNNQNSSSSSFGYFTRNVNVTSTRNGAGSSSMDRVGGVQGSIPNVSNNANRMSSMGVSSSSVSIPGNDPNYGNDPVILARLRNDWDSVRSLQQQPGHSHPGQSMQNNQTSQQPPRSSVILTRAADRQTSLVSVLPVNSSSNLHSGGSGNLHSDGSSTLHSGGSPVRINQGTNNSMVTSVSDQTASTSIIRNPFTESAIQTPQYADRNGTTERGRSRGFSYGSQNHGPQNHGSQNHSWNRRTSGFQSSDDNRYQAPTVRYNLLGTREYRPRQIDVNRSQSHPTFGRGDASPGPFGRGDSSPSAAGRESSFPIARAGTMGGAPTFGGGSDGNPLVHGRAAAIMTGRTPPRGPLSREPPTRGPGGAPAEGPGGSPDPRVVRSRTLPGRGPMRNPHRRFHGHSYGHGAHRNSRHSSGRTAAVIHRTQRANPRTRYNSDRQVPFVRDPEPAAERTVRLPGSTQNNRRPDGTKKKVRGRKKRHQIFYDDKKLMEYIGELAGPAFLDFTLCDDAIDPISQEAIWDLATEYSEELSLEPSLEISLEVEKREKERNEKAGKEAAEKADKEKLATIDEEKFPPAEGMVLPKLFDADDNETRLSAAGNSPFLVASPKVEKSISCSGNKVPSGKEFIPIEIDEENEPPSNKQTNPTTLPATLLGTDSLTGGSSSSSMPGPSSIAAASGTLFGASSGTTMGHSSSGFTLSASTKVSMNVDVPIVTEELAIQVALQEDVINIANTKEELAAAGVLADTSAWVTALPNRTGAGSSAVEAGAEEATGAGSNAVGAASSSVGASSSSIRAASPTHTNKDCVSTLSTPEFGTKMFPTPPGIQQLLEQAKIAADTQHVIQEQQRQQNLHPEAAPLYPASTPSCSAMHSPVHTPRSESGKGEKDMSLCETPCRTPLQTPRDVRMHTPSNGSARASSHGTPRNGGTPRGGGLPTGSNVGMPRRPTPRRHSARSASARGSTPRSARGATPRSSRLLRWDRVASEDAEFPFDRIPLTSRNRNPFELTPVSARIATRADDVAMKSPPAVKKPEKKKKPKREKRKENRSEIQWLFSYVESEMVKLPVKPSSPTEKDKSSGGEKDDAALLSSSADPNAASSSSVPAPAASYSSSDVPAAAASSSSSASSASASTAVASSFATHDAAESRTPLIPFSGSSSSETAPSNTFSSGMCSSSSVGSSSTSFTTTGTTPFTAVAAASSGLFSKRATEKAQKDEDAVAAGSALAKKVESSTLTIAKKDTKPQTEYICKQFVRGFSIESIRNLILESKKSGEWPKVLHPVSRKEIPKASLYKAEKMFRTLEKAGKLRVEQDHDPTTWAFKDIVENENPEAQMRLLALAVFQPFYRKASLEIEKDVLDGLPLENLKALFKQLKALFNRNLTSDQKVLIATHGKPFEGAPYWTWDVQRWQYYLLREIWYVTSYNVNVPAYVSKLAMYICLAALVTCVPKIRDRYAGSFALDAMGM